MPCRTQKKKKKELSHDHFSDYKSEKGINFYKFLSNFFFFLLWNQKNQQKKNFFFFLFQDTVIIQLKLRIIKLLYSLFNNINTL